MTENEFKAATDVLNEIIGVYTKQHLKRAEKGLELRIKQLNSIKSLIKNNYADIALLKLKAESNEAECYFLSDKVKQLEALNCEKSTVLKLAEKKIEDLAKEWRLE